MGIAKKDEKAEKAAAEAPEDPPVVKQLKEICDEYSKIEMEFEKKVEELQIEYTKKQKPLLQQRKEVLMKAEGENAPATGTPALMGFWLKAMQNHPAFEELIQEWDEPVLEFLQDITSAPLDETDCNKGFELIFKFAPNPYFENTELKKVYETERGSIYNGEIDAKEIKADVLKWNTGKDITVEKVAKKVKGGGAKKAKQKKEKEEARPSFFRDFFRNLKPGEPLPDDAKEQARMMADDEEEEDDDDDEDLIAYLMENDLEIGQCVRDNIIPWAVRWYTGEASPEEDDDDDEDEEEEDYDDDDDEDDSEEPPKGKAGRGRAGAPPPKKGGKKPTPKGSPEQKPGEAPKEECKQQ
mmetsp:Transcript_88061/g.252365  ORF Transcript_88061/g.252365 Transcript_88061/m.252365 type:complete len:354 (-) Transcript_88061:254-1315(-)